MTRLHFVCAVIDSLRTIQMSKTVLKLLVKSETITLIY